MSWEPATADDLKRLEQKCPQRMSLQETECVLKDPDLCALLPDWARVYWENGDALGVIGAWPAWGGVAVVWAVLSDELIARPMTLCKGARHWIEYLAEREGIHRLQTMIEPGKDGSLRWIRWLGFEREGLMERASPRGTDLWLYARVF
jgi:hypothetical protein